MEHLAWLEHVSYLALLGAAASGMEGLVVLAGHLSTDGGLGFTPIGIFTTAAAGAFLGNTAWFWLGRAQGIWVTRRFPHLALHADNAQRFFERFGAWAVFIAHYLIGLRVPLVVFMGVGRMRWGKFLPLQVLASLLWAAIFTFLGASLTFVLGRSAMVHTGIVLLVLGGVLAGFVWHRSRDRRAKAARELVE